MGPLKVLKNKIRNSRESNIMSDFGDKKRQAGAMLKIVKVFKEIKERAEEEMFDSIRSPGDLKKLIEICFEVLNKNGFTLKQIIINTLRENFKDRLPSLEEFFEKLRAVLVARIKN